MQAVARGVAKADIRKASPAVASRGQGTCKRESLEPRPTARMHSRMRSPDASAADDVIKLNPVDQS